MHRLAHGYTQKDPSNTRRANTVPNAFECNKPAPARGIDVLVESLVSIVHEMWIIKEGRRRVNLASVPIELCLASRAVHLCTPFSPRDWDCTSRAWPCLACYETTREHNRDAALMRPCCDLTAVGTRTCKTHDTLTTHDSSIASDSCTCAFRHNTAGPCTCTSRRDLR